MNKTKIPWCAYTINPVTGMCPVDCKDSQGKSYCYARQMYKRFKWNPEIRFEEHWHYELGTIKKPSRIFMGSTMELFGDWVQQEWLNKIFLACSLWKPHTFIFLTKQPENLVKWSPFPLSTNIGVSVTNQEQYDNALKYLTLIEAPVKFLSLEPLLGRIDLTLLADAGISWVIIGQKTPASKNTTPKIKWVKEIVESCDKAHIPVFVKEPLASLYRINRKEFPKQ